MEHVRRRDLVDILDIPWERSLNKSTPTSEWDRARLPNADHWALIVGEFNSESQKNHLADNEYRETALGLPVAAFSYLGGTRHYLPNDTNQRVTSLAQLLASSLESAKGTVAVLGFSMGGAVAPLGLSTWLKLVSKSKFLDALTISHLVLVAPAISPIPALAEHYKLRVATPGYHRSHRSTLPAGIRQTCDRQSSAWRHLQQEYAWAFRQIVVSEILIHVVYCRDDLLTPFPWDASLMAQVRGSLIEHPAPAPDVETLEPSDPDYFKSVALFHNRFLRSASTVELVRSILDSK